MEVSYELKRKRSGSIGADNGPISKRQQITRKFQPTQKQQTIPSIIQLTKHIARVSCSSFFYKLFLFSINYF